MTKKIKDPLLQTLYAFYNQRKHNVTEYFDQPEDRWLFLSSKLEPDNIVRFRVKFSRTFRQITFRWTLGHSGVVTVEYSEKTHNIVQDIDQIYIPVRWEVQTATTLEDEGVLSSIFLWGLEGRREPRTSYHRAPAHEYHDDTQLTDNTVLYWGVIDTVTDDIPEDAVVGCVEIQFDNQSRHLFQHVTLEDARKLKSGKVLLFNSEGRFNVFDYTNALSHLYWTPDVVEQVGRRVSVYTDPYRSSRLAA